MAWAQRVWIEFHLLRQVNWNFQPLRSNLVPVGRHKLQMLKQSDKRVVDLSNLSRTISLLWAMPISCWGQHWWHFKSPSGPRLEGAPSWDFARKSGRIWETWPRIQLELKMVWQNGFDVIVGRWRTWGSEKKGVQFFLLLFRIFGLFCLILALCGCSLGFC